MHCLERQCVSKSGVFFTASNSGPFMDILIYTPTQVKKAPVFIGLNFRGNQSIDNDPNIEISSNFFAFLKKAKTKLSDTLNRGEQARRWEVEALLQKGYGVATVYYGDLEMDYVDGWQSGIRNNLQNELGIKPSEWSAIGAWAWGLSRLMDYLVTDADVDSSRVIVTGHSRLGKTALWAGANDNRFAAVVSNNSGEGGAALTRRWFGETTSIINTQFPHWFVNKYKDYNSDASALPVDQHMLLALIAPRPLYVASASEDRWADPKGEFLSLKNAEPVYRLLNKKGLGVDIQPAPDHPVGNTLRYHLRTGKHEMLMYDWLQYIKFADETLR